jgi:glycosyltransferase involved in cell wall biosynthesis
MKILSITAGAAGMYCGSCSRDNALAVELLARGHDVTLVPLYTPTMTDETNVSRDRVLFGGISIYLQQHLSLFRMTPRFVDRLWDAPRVIRAFASRSLSTDPRLLGDLTISMLEGEQGVLRKEFEKLLEWFADEPVPDVVNLPNSLLIALARPLRDALKRPICCTLQGEDLFLEGLVEPYRGRALELIRRHVPDVDRFIAVSDYYLPTMSSLLGIASDRMAVVPLGINLAGYERRHGESDRGRGEDDVFRVGYFARIAPEKGLHLLANAYPLFRRRTGDARVQLEAAGYLSAAHAPYLEDVRRSLDKAGLGHEFTYRGAVDRDGKLAFLRSLDVLSVPATYDEPKGVFLLEAAASGVPVVQPRRGAFTEIVEKTGGGLLVAPDDPEALAEGLYALWHDRSLAESLGERGFHGVRAHYSIAHSADRLLDVYHSLVGCDQTASTEPRQGTESQRPVSEAHPVSVATGRR